MALQPNLLTAARGGPGPSQTWVWLPRFLDSSSARSEVKKTKRRVYKRVFTGKDQEVSPGQRTWIQQDLDPAGPVGSCGVCVCVCPEETRLGSGLVHTQFNDTVRNGVGGPGGQPEPEPDGFWMRSYRQHWAAAPARRFTAWFLSE